MPMSGSVALGAVRIGLYVESMTNGDQHNRNRFLNLAMIAIFDIAGPLVAYSLLRSAGHSAVTALVLRAPFRPWASPPG